MSGSMDGSMVGSISGPLDCYIGRFMLGSHTKCLGNVEGRR